jgi:hypothetical protein
LAKYRFLQDAVDINGIYYQAGSIASTADVGGTLPAGWIPPAAVDPIDAAAIQAFWNAGPQQLGLCRQQWNGIGVAPPAIYWTSFPPGGGTQPMILTGAGAALGFRNWLSPRGANA